MKKISKLNMCGCFPSLPSAYSDSLSYYEAVSTLENKTNEIIENINDNLETYIRDNLDKLFIDSMYNAETETLVLVLKQGD